MNRIKDLIYDTSDIMVAMLILVCAILIIFTRFNAIITYPEKMIADQNTQSGHIRPDIPDESGPVPGDDDVITGDDGDDNDEDVNAPLPPENSAPSSYSLYIAYGENMNDVAKDLIQLGLFKTSQDFSAALERNNAGMKVQAGNFIIPSGATEDEVVRIITSTPSSL